jgi:hypothetical protein
MRLCHATPSHTKHMTGESDAARLHCSQRLVNRKQCVPICNSRCRGTYLALEHQQIVVLRLMTKSVLHKRRKVSPQSVAVEE